MKQIISKWFSIMLLIMVSAISASAQTLTMADVTIKAGETAMVAVNLTADNAIYGIQADLTLSEGLTLEGNATTAVEGLTIAQNVISTGPTRIVLYSQSGATIAAGEVIKLTVKASDTFEEGALTLDNIRFTTSNTGTEVKGTAVTANVTLEQEEQPAQGEKVIYYWPDNAEQANEITFDDGAKVAITGNTDKKIQQGSKITVNGTEYVSMKVSNGAQNTLTLPKNAIAITFYSYVNKDAATNRAPYWKEVAGVEYTEETSGGTMTSYKDGAHPDVRTFTFKPTKTVTFTNTGEQLCYVMEVTYQSGDEPTPDPALTEAKTKLQTAITYAEDIGAEELAEAIAAAETALNAEDATVDSLTAAQAALVAAVKEYAQAALQNAINLAGAVAGDTGALTEAINNANAVLNDTASTPEQLLEALATLEAAAKEFAKTTLTNAIAAAQALDTTDKAGVDELNAAITAAQSVLDDEASTLEQLYDAGVALKRAVDNFQAANPTYTFTNQKYLVMNVASEKYWGAGNDWGTRASLVPHAEYVKLVPQNDGTYFMESQVNNGGEQYYFNGDYMDNGSPVALTIKQAEILGYSDEEETIPVYAYTIANGDNYYGWDGTSTVLGKNLAADSENALWVIVSLDEAKAALADATVDDPADATFLIEDHDFGRNNRYANKWTAEGVNNISGGNNTNNCAESYHAAFTLSQTLEGAPAGIYALTAQGFYRQDGEDNDNLPVFFANDKTAFFPLKTGSENSMSEASTSFSAGNYTIDPIYVQVEEGGTLTIGAKLETNTNLWCIWDNFVLTYYGTDADLDEVKNAAIIKELADLRAKAEELKEEVEVEAVQTTLDDALNATASVEGADAINAAIETMKTAIDKAEASVTAKNVLPKMKELTESTNVYTQEAYEKYYGQWVVKYEDGSLTKDEANALQDPFVLTGWHANATANTLLMSVWDEPAYNWDSYHLNTWSTEGNGDGSNFVVPFIEYWTGDGNSLGEKTLTATMNNVPEGVYDITAWVRVRIKNGAEGSATGITLQANDGDPVDVCTGDQVGESQFYLKEFTAQGTVGEDGVLNIKFIVAADNNISWLSFKDVNYAKTAVVDAELAAAKEALSQEIATATATAEAAADSDAKTTLQEAIATAQDALNAADATVESLQQALAALKAAEDAYATATGINAVTATQGRNAEVYNLSGQRVTKTQKGLYIVNGKKVVR